MKKISLKVLYAILLSIFISCGDETTKYMSGTSILYERNYGWPAGIFRINIDGTNKVQLVGNESDAYEPEVSRDGLKVVYTSRRQQQLSKIFVMDIDGFNHRVITLEDRNDRYPSWSMDGSKVVFFSYKDEIKGINVMNSDGTNIINVFRAHFIEWPSFSPDGSKIMFVAYTDDPLNYNEEIFTINLDGSNRLRITYNDFHEIRPRYSPDGSKIAFHGRTGLYESGQIYILEGDSLTNISNSETGDYFPSWSPDGLKIVFSRADNENSGLYIMDNDGGNVVRIPNTEGIEKYPCWIP